MPLSTGMSVRGKAAIRPRLSQESVHLGKQAMNRRRSQIRTLPAPAGWPQMRMHSQLLEAKIYL